MPERYDRRTFLGRALRTTAGGVLLPSAAAAFLDACGSGSTSNLPSTPRRGGSVTFATEAEINSFDARQGAWDSTGLQYARTVFDPLFTQAADGTVQPYLAQSISHSADYMQWTIKLRSGITFHDGSPLDATVVKANLDGVAQSPLTGPALFNLDKVTVVDPMTVMVTTKSPWVPFPIYLTGQLGHIAGLKQLADTSGKASPIGTGPFVFKEWLPGDHFTATRNPSYWRQGLPYLDSITYKPIPDPQSR
ncbi:MAG TPA: ABC transporter substrate-binding protein, partial [Candidatus Dormibacteraeota bacterium]